MLNHQAAPGSSRPKRRRRRSSWIVLAFFAFLVLVMLRPRLPWLEDTWMRWVHPDQWRAHQACRKQALQAAEHRDFGRLLHGGQVFVTENGYYVKDVTVGEMAAGGQEAQYRYSCYLDAAFNIVRSGRQDTAPAP